MSQGWVRRKDMVQARALSIKRDSLSLCKGGVALDLPRSVWPECWG